MVVVHVQMPSPPSSPADHRFCFLSAPTSPSRASDFYLQFDDYTIPADTDDFAFHVSRDPPNSSVSAAELFSGGRIRPLEPTPTDTPGYRYRRTEPETSVRSPLPSPDGSTKSTARRRFWNVFTPKKNRAEEQVRGRERVCHSSLSISASRRLGTRSVSPIREPKNLWKEDKKMNESAPPLEAPAPSKSSRRWRLKNFLLFRSASEGRASEKDPMRKVTAFYRRQEGVSEKPLASPRRSPISAHERHYTANKAASEDLKRKTFLPYKQGILGRLAVNPNPPPC